VTTRILRVLERRFVVPGRAVSFRSPASRTYKRQVRTLARPVFPKRPPRHSVEVLLDYFHTKRRRVDMDNVAKCVLDALSGVAYVDDRQVLHQYSRAHDLLEPLFLPGGPVDLVKPLAEHTEYLFVRVRLVASGDRPVKQRKPGPLPR
jgi:hypothetical protein